MVYQYVNKLCFRKVLGFSSPYFFSFLKQFRFSFSYFARSQLFRVYVFLKNFAPEIGARAAAKMIPSCMPVVWPVCSRNLKLVIIHDDVTIVSETTNLCIFHKMATALSLGNQLQRYANNTTKSGDRRSDWNYLTRDHQLSNHKYPTYYDSFTMFASDRNLLVSKTTTTKIANCHAAKETFFILCKRDLMKNLTL